MFFTYEIANKFTQKNKRARGRPRKNRQETPTTKTMSSIEYNSQYRIINDFYRAFNIESNVKPN